MNKMIYNACEGRPGDMKALENSTYWDFCSVLNNYLEKVDRHNKEMDKVARENNLNSTRKPTGKKSSYRKKDL